MNSIILNRILLFLRNILCECKEEGSLDIYEALDRRIRAESEGMSDSDKSFLWYSISQLSFSILGKVEIYRRPISTTIFYTTLKECYPSLTDIKIADGEYWITDIEGISNIMKKDWTNLVPYVENLKDCDKAGVRLFLHLSDYYDINTCVPVWGDTDRGYHGFNIIVLESNNKFIARLIEPQSDKIFTESGPLGKYIPKRVAIELGVLDKKSYLDLQLKLAEV